MNRIRLLRNKHHMTQTELGNLLNVKDAAISKYETGKIPITTETIIRLTEIFHVSSDYLLGLTDEESEVPDACCPLPEEPLRNGGSATRKNSIGYWIYKSGLSKETVADKLGITPEMLDTYCNGGAVVPKEHLTKLCSICGTSEDCLLGLKRAAGQKPPEQPPYSDYDPETSKRLKRLLHAQGLTYQKTAKLLGLEEEDVYDLVEHGVLPQISVLARLAGTLEASVDYILNLSDSMITITPEDEPICMAARKLKSYNYAIAYAEILKLVKEEEKEKESRT